MQASHEDEHPAHSEDVLAASVARRVEGIVEHAERTAANLQLEVEGSARRQAAEIRAAAEADAARIRRDAEALVGRWLAESRERIDAFVAHRIARIEELADALIGRGDAIQQRFEAAETIRGQLDHLTSALGDAAELLAREVPGRVDIPRLEAQDAHSALAPGAAPPPARLASRRELPPANPQSPR